MPVTSKLHPLAKEKPDIKVTNNHTSFLHM
jgi:hypothetical protein